MDKIAIKAAAKINLLLDICGCLENGYHKMDMIMQSIDLYDTVELKLGEPGIRMTCDDENLLCDESNICVRCAKAFYEYTKIQPQIDIYLQKNVPMMAGLGGGSADGAAVLCGLNKLHKTNISCITLCEIGFKIGADIPFCIMGGTQRVRGAGEVLSEVFPLNNDIFVLVAKPKFSVSTKLAFQSFDQEKNPPRADVNSMILALERGFLSEIAANLSNVFEPFCKPQELNKIKNIMLKNGAEGALMSGSGSAVFALFENEKLALECAEILKNDMESVFVVKPLDKGIYAMCE